MKQLCLEFKNSDAKSRVLRLNNIDDNLDAETVRSAMTKIAATNMFIKKGIELYKEPVGAKYVERIETPIFSDK